MNTSEIRQLQLKTGVATAHLVEKPRHMLPEDVHKKLIHKEIVKIYIDYEKFFQTAFTCYFQMNYNKNRVVGFFL